MPGENKAFEFGPFRLEIRERRLTRDGQSIPLRGKVFDTLLALVTHHGSLMTKDELMAAVWGDTIVEENNLNHNICVLRRALGEKVGGQEYIETVPRQGYRFVAHVEEFASLDSTGVPGLRNARQGLAADRDTTLEALLPALTSQPQTAIPNGTEGPRPALGYRWNARRAIVGLLVVLALFLGGYYAGKRPGIFRSRANARTMLAVLPFENLTGDTGQQHIADGLSHEIISQLGRWNASKIGVIGHTSSKAYRGTRKPIEEVGRELKVDYIVEGSMRRYNAGYRITVLLIRVKDQAHVWAESYDRATVDATTMQVEIAEIIAREINSRIAVTPEASLQPGALPSVGACCRALGFPASITLLR